MSPRSDLLPRLAMIPSAELLELLGDDAISALAAKYLPSNQSSPGENGESSSSVDPSSLSMLPGQASPRPKRPLNAFMAFRSYYSKVFPDIQQKAISGFLTTLWNQEPCRNRWALIAKVYSFVRDEVKPGRVSLAEFLGVCCPIMKIIDPCVYLSTLGWMVRHDIDGSPFLVRDPSGATITYGEIESHIFPTTESDILKSLLNVGYLPEDSSALIARMNANSNALMTTSPVPTNAQKRRFINTIRRDATQATRELFGQHFDEQVMQDHGYRVHNTNDLGAIGHLPMALPPRVPIRPYQGTTTLSQLEMNNNRPVINWDPVPEHDPFDINNPFALDHLMGFTQMEGEQTADLPPSPPYRTEEDFHFTF